jgi:hypothetical protein
VRERLLLLLLHAVVGVMRAALASSARARLLLLLLVARGASGRHAARAAGDRSWHLQQPTEQMVWQQHTMLC